MSTVQTFKAAAKRLLLALPLLTGLGSLSIPDAVAVGPTPNAGYLRPSLPPWGGSSNRPVSLKEALPSPTPMRNLPPMPPEIPGSFVFYEDFEKEGAMANWTITRSHKTVGWHRLKASTCGGLFTMVLGVDKNPPTTLGKGESMLTLKRPIDLRKQKTLQLQYDVRGEMRPPETAVIICEGRVPGRAWKPLAPRAEARYPLVVTFTADLSSYAGKKLELRFRGLTQTIAYPTKGYYLDDIVVIAPAPKGTK